MTVTSEQLPGTKRIVVRDEIGPLEFDGEMVADLSWDYSTAAEYGHDRWTDLSLYRVLQEGSEYTYVVQVVGRSVVYHKVGGSCRGGMRRMVGVLKQNNERFNALRICDRCDPDDLDEMRDTDTVNVEEDLPTLYKCKGAKEVVDVLYSRIIKEKRAGLSMKLLQAAADADPEISAQVRRMRSL